MPFERGTQLCMLTCCLQDNIQLFPKYENADKVDGDQQIAKSEPKECVGPDG